MEVRRDGRGYIRPRLTAVDSSDDTAILADSEPHTANHHTALHTIQPCGVFLVAFAVGVVFIRPEESIFDVPHLATVTRAEFQSTQGGVNTRIECRQGRACRAVKLEAAIFNHRPAGVWKARPSHGGVDVVVAEEPCEADVAVQL